MIHIISRIKKRESVSPPDNVNHSKSELQSFRLRSTYTAALFIRTSISVNNWGGKCDFLTPYSFFWVLELFIIRMRLLGETPNSRHRLKN